VNERNLTNGLLWLAVFAFLASWFLPVADRMAGWEAFRYALAPLIPFRDTGTPASEDNIPRVLSALTNLVFVILIVLWQTKQSFRPGLFLRIALACLLINLYWPVMAWRAGELATLQSGYYAWEAAFALLTAAAIITASATRRTSRTPTAGTPS
jgi:hypothetical protein